MLEPLPEELIARIMHRASDPNPRTDAPPAAFGQSVSIGSLSITGVTLDSVLRGKPTSPRGPRVLKTPLDASTVAEAERRLRFALPPPLRQLYTLVADGGFGPGSGLMSLDDVVATYDALTKRAPGRRGQKWPVQLLPVTHTDPGHDCLDLTSGEVIFWDEEHLAAGGSDKVWRQSFKNDAPDLAVWFDRWLSTPSPEERTKDLIQRAQLDAIRQSLAVWRTKTPEERAAFGLPETGWEEVLFGHLGIDLTKL
jgi:SMI1/KNR4 family protein SUKH-1